MSTLMDDLSAIPVSTGCVTCDWLQQQEPKAREVFWARVDTCLKKLGSYADLYNVCTVHGLEVSNRSFREHCQRPRCRGAA